MTATLPQTITPNPARRRQVETLSGQKISTCYQCEKCSNGCPVTFAMDILPHKLMRLVNLGVLDEVLCSDTIWVCASCETCTTRCPNGIDIAHVMDTLRQMSRQEGKVSQKNAPIFHNEFLASIKNHGRVHELEMITKYTLKSEGIGGLLKQRDLGLKMLRKGKLKLVAGSTRSKKQVKDIFKQARGRG